MFEIKYLDKDVSERLDLIVASLEDAIDMIRSHDADRDIEISGFIDPSDFHGTLILHFGSK